MNTVVRRYTFRLYPNATQAARMEQIRRQSCYLYNALVEQRRDAWDRCRKSLSCYDQQRECTLLANDPAMPEWRSFPSVIRERVAERVDQAFKKYFDNVKAWRRGQWSKPFPPSPPRYQKSAEFSGFGVKANGAGWKFISDRRVYLTGVGQIRMRGRFPSAPAELRTADILWRDGRWEISIVGKFEESGVMRTPTRPFSSESASNFLLKTKGYARIRCSNPTLEGEPQAPSMQIDPAAGCSNPALEGEPQVGILTWVQPFRCSNPALDRHGPARGRKNALRRWRNNIARRDHAMHEYTSYIAAHGGNVEITRPPLKAATATGKGDMKEPGALVSFKARMNRDLLDRGIGKLTEQLKYKVEARGNTFVCIEDDGHQAMIPELAASTAKLGKTIKRVARRDAKTQERAA